MLTQLALLQFFAAPFKALAPDRLDSDNLAGCFLKLNSRIFYLGLVSNLYIGWLFYQAKMNIENPCHI